MCFTPYISLMTEFFSRMTPLTSWMHIDAILFCWTYRWTAYQRSSTSAQLLTSYKYWICRGNCLLSSSHAEDPIAAFGFFSATLLGEKNLTWRSSLFVWISESWFLPKTKSKKCALLFFCRWVIRWIFERVRQIPDSIRTLLNLMVLDISMNKIKNIQHLDHAVSLYPEYLSVQSVSSKTITLFVSTEETQKASIVWKSNWDCWGTSKVSLCLRSTTVSVNLLVLLFKASVFAGNWAAKK